MGLVTYNPTSPGRRFLITTDRSELWKGKPVKTLTEGLSASGGRNNTGRMTTRHRGGGHKRTYRIVDFKRTKFDLVGTVERLEYDPNRTAWIALVKYEDGELSYIVAPQRLAAGDKVVSSLSTVDVKPGNAMPLERMPVGTIVHNVEMKPRKGGQIARSAGAYAQYVGRDQGWAILRLNSGEQRRVHGSCLATVGAVSNQDHANTVVGKAGRNRWLGIKPQTRGIAMNPVDHPHGGRTKGGMHWTTPWGGAAKGQKTRSNKRTDKFIVRSRHVKKGR
ncbi:50S ribosomal protein L2 [Frateuria sp.]|uniref:50S ribosomal protein L2 n=1 Tax=Frateuria sp. TaxID=2211372 RepID=UPI003F80C483